jgi:SAM-dependent methyltransferase
MTTHDDNDEIRFSRKFWDERYGSADRLWSGQPNVQLAAQVASLPAGEALDVGCGEGADAIWLASRGWRVTAVDVSAVALERGARQAVVEDVSDQITWQQRDLLSWAPEPLTFDLVSAQFMHLPGPAQETMHTRLAAAVRPGGTLLIVGHLHEGMHAHRPAHLFRSAQDIAGGLDPAEWQVLVADTFERPGTLDGQPATLIDSVLRAVRRPAADAG